MTNAPDPAAADPDPLGALDPAALLRGALGEEQAESEEFERVLRAEIERRLPDLELFECLGRGGMGTVFRARQRRLDRSVALKVLTPREETPAGLPERFEREARTLARLVHPGIVTIHESGREDDFCWLLMECVEGTTLRDLLRQGALDPARALLIVEQLCAALQYAHERGVVHRDIKPENVLMDVDGRPKIADFGLAKLLGEPAALVSLTASRQVLGTLRYMAPEQLDRPLEVDHRADLYALGVVIYEMLTGEVPVGRFELPSTRVHTPLQLDDVVVRSLEREPARRYQHASEVGSAVEDVRAHMAREPVRQDRVAASSAVLQTKLALGAKASLATLLLSYVAIRIFSWIYAWAEARVVLAQRDAETLSVPVRLILAWRDILFWAPTVFVFLILVALVSGCICGWWGLRLARGSEPRERTSWALHLAAWALPWTALTVPVVLLGLLMNSTEGVWPAYVAQVFLPIWILGLIAVAGIHRARRHAEPRR